MQDVCFVDKLTHNFELRKLIDFFMSYFSLDFNKSYKYKLEPKSPHIQRFFLLQLAFSMYVY